MHAHKHHVLHNFSMTSTLRNVCAFVYVAICLNTSIPHQRMCVWTKPTRTVAKHPLKRGACKINYVSHNSIKTSVDPDAHGCIIGVSSLIPHACRPAFRVRDPSTAEQIPDVQWQAHTTDALSSPCQNDSLGLPQSVPVIAGTRQPQ